MHQPQQHTAKCALNCIADNQPNVQNKLNKASIRMDSIGITVILQTWRTTGWLIRSLISKCKVIFDTLCCRWCSYALARKTDFLSSVAHHDNIEFQVLLAFSIRLDYKMGLLLFNAKGNRSLLRQGWSGTLLPIAAGRSVESWSVATDTCAKGMFHRLGVINFPGEIFVLFVLQCLQSWNVSEARSCAPPVRFNCDLSER